MILKSLSKNFYFSLIFIVLIFLLDRISKIYVINLSKQLLKSEIFSSKFLNISLIWNEGIAFGLFSFSDNHIYHLITFLIIVVIIVIFVMIVRNYGFKKYSLIMVFGGALGNLYDRIVFGAVPDFIDFHIKDIHWFIFNVSDIFITIGVLCLIMVELLDDKRDNKDEKI